MYKFNLFNSLHKQSYTLHLLFAILSVTCQESEFTCFLFVLVFFFNTVMQFVLYLLVYIRRQIRFATARIKLFNTPNASHSKLGLACAFWDRNP